MCSTRVSLSKQNTTALSRPRCFVEAFFPMFCALHMLASCLPCIDSPHCGFQDLFHHCSSLSEVSSIQIIFPDPRPTPQEYRRYTTTPNIYIYIYIYISAYISNQVGVWLFHCLIVLLCALFCYLFDACYKSNSHRNLRLKGCFVDLAASIVFWWVWVLICLFIASHRTRWL